MKAIVLKSVFVMAFGATSFTTAHAEHQGTFIYGEDAHTLLVSTLNQDGKTLTPSSNTNTNETQTEQLQKKKHTVGINTASNGSQPTC